jgi:excisionase family DNA binding protein
MTRRSNPIPLSVISEPDSPPEFPRPLLWDLKTTCKQLSISRRTAERLMSAGRFVMPMRIGRSLRFRPDDVLTWLNDLARGRGAR